MSILGFVGLMMLTILGFFYECGANYEMLDVPIKGIVKLTFKRWLDKDEIEYAIN